MADGQILINTRIDTSGIDKGTVNVQRQFDKMASSAKKTSESIHGTFSGKNAPGTGFADGLGENEDRIRQILDDTEKTVKAKAMSIAAIYREMGVPKDEALSKAWDAVGRKNETQAKKFGKNLGDNITTGVSGAIRKIGTLVTSVFAVRQIINFGKSASSAASTLSSALMGLQSIVEGQGRSFTTARAFIDEYIQDGLIPATNAITAYKNLASRGYDDTQIRQVMTALKDASAFGRQASLSMGDAVQSATEGLKNENSVLVDNAGVTKNVAKMWEEYARSIGTTADKLTQQQKIQAEVTGILQETRFQTGDAAKVANTFAGQVQRLSFAFNDFKVAVGNIINPIAQVLLPVLTAAVTQMTRFANAAASVVAALTGKSAGTAAKSAQSIADGYASAAENASGLAEATEKAGKAAKRSAAGFDEMNILSTDTGAGSAAGGAANVNAAVLPTITEDVAELENNGAVIFFDRMKSAMERFRDSFVQAVSVIRSGAERVTSVFSTIRADLSALAAPLKAWLSGPLTDHINQFISTTGTVLGGLLDTIGLVFGDVWSVVLYPTIQQWTIDILPALTGFGTQVLGAFGVLFTEVKTIFDRIWAEAVAPALAWIQGIWSDAWSSIQTVWAQSGAPIFDKLREAIQGASDYWQNGWETILLPIWQKVMEVVDQFWTDHLKPLWDNFVGFVAMLTDGALEIYNEFILPVANWFMSTFGGPIREVINDAIGQIGDFFGMVADVASGVIDSLKGVTDFLVGVFTGDWNRAWEGIAGFFKGIVNGLIAAAEYLANSFVLAINKMINAANMLHFDVPDWVPMIGGKKFGFNIPTLKEVSIPRLAAGAVIPPNREFMAVLGDQKHGTNLEAPEDLIRKIVREESGGGASDRPIVFVLKIGKRTLGKAVVDSLNELTRQNGELVLEMG